MTDIVSHQLLLKRFEPFVKFLAIQPEQYGIHSKNIVDYLTDNLELREVDYRDTLIRTLGLVVGTTCVQFNDMAKFNNELLIEIGKVMGKMEELDDNSTE